MQIVRNEDLAYMNIHNGHGPTKVDTRIRRLVVCQYVMVSRVYVRLAALVIVNIAVKIIEITIYYLPTY
jgi:hypothetical protein